MADLELNSCQNAALEVLEGTSNVFLTGVAGSGKSFLIRHFLRHREMDSFPILASTGAAAILVGGRTFHSYFGLGIMQGGFDATVERALKNSRLVKRLKKTEGVVIDEISMLSGPTLRAAEAISRIARGRDTAWGGLRIIAVGDFAQLPPVSQVGRREWAFQDSTWARSNFVPFMLKTIMRSKDEAYLEILNQVRNGICSEKVANFLDARKLPHPGEFLGTRLFPRRDMTEQFNLQKLAEIGGEAKFIQTEYRGAEKSIGDLKRSSPVPEVISLKKDALIMMRQNDPMGRFVNGSLGTIIHMTDEKLRIKLLSGREVDIEKASFSLLDAEGKEVATAKNFPVNLAYATTIHKAQGMTLDSLMVDLRNLWEPGQAYVAMSRVKESTGIFVTAWTQSSIKTDPDVSEFYRGVFGAQYELE